MNDQADDQADDQNESVATDLAETTEDPTIDAGGPSVADPTAETSISEDATANLTGAEPSAPAEDSGDQSTKKAEAASPGAKSAPEEEWRKHLKRFHNDINGVFAAKENFMLVCVDKQAKDSFARNWKQEANKYFQLVVNLRRRNLGSKVGGKTVA